MLIRLADHLDVPLRERNIMLLAAGFAPAYGERKLTASELSAARDAIDHLLHSHNPHPALAVDRHWTLVSANKAVGVLTQGASSHLLEGEVNVLRLSLHPDGLASRIINFREWRSHILSRLMHDIEISGDTRLVALLEELRSYPVPAHVSNSGAPARDRPIAIPLVIASDEGPLEFLSTTTVFGTAVDVTLADIVIENFFPANAQTATAMSILMSGKPDDVDERLQSAFQAQQAALNCSNRRLLILRSRNSGFLGWSSKPQRA
jgi:hypothetical protein